MSETTANGLVSLSYISNSIVPPGVPQQRQFGQILEISRAKNPRLSITGALLFHDERWLQVLEGGREKVEALFATIRSDNRHDNVVHQGTLAIDERQFASWSMAFLDPGAAGLAFCGLSLKELQESETASAAPVIEWMREKLVGAEPN